MSTRPTSLFVAEGIALDQLTARLTAFNILDNVFASNLPALLPRIHVVGIYELPAMAETLLAKIEILDPSGVSISSPSQIRVEFSARTPGQPPVCHTTIHAIWNLAFRTEGDHKVRLSHRASEDDQWTQIQELTLTVRKAPHPLAQAAESPAPAQG